MRRESSSPRYIASNFAIHDDNTCIKFTKRQLMQIVCTNTNKRVKSINAFYGHKSEIFIILVLLCWSANELRSPFPRDSARKTQLRRNVAAVPSRGRHCVRLDLHGNRTPDFLRRQRFLWPLKIPIASSCTMLWVLMLRKKGSILIPSERKNKRLNFVENRNVFVKLQWEI